jgi:hypothetical protein
LKKNIRIWKNKTEAGKERETDDQKIGILKNSKKKYTKIKI